jgi:hypothetical protein
MELFLLMTVNAFGQSLELQPIKGDHALLLSVARINKNMTARCNDTQQQYDTKRYRIECGYRRRIRGNRHRISLALDHAHSKAQTYLKTIAALII